MLIELIGIFEFFLVVVMFDFCMEEGDSFLDVVCIDIMVIVVDVVNFLCDFFSYEFFCDFGELLGEEDVWILVYLLID